MIFQTVPVFRAYKLRLIEGEAVLFTKIVLKWISKL